MHTPRINNMGALALAANKLDEAHVHHVYLRENAFDKAYEKMQQYLKADPQGRFAPHVKEIMKQMESSGAVVAVGPAK